MAHARQAMVLFLIDLLATACTFADPLPPEPSEAGIGIMAMGSGICEPTGGLTWVAGTHEVTFIEPKHGRVRVTLVDSAGRTVLQRHGNWRTSSTVTLAPGRYRLRCSYGGGSSGSSTLIVTRG